eukprot:GILI01040573.1.p1 GENE.GILI01040573.1~~GILI01040573.1.p1  ORF type:complete len:129 (-),score=27.18 GILI01040573.1:53-439(-)
MTKTISSLPHVRQLATTDVLDVLREHQVTLHNAVQDDGHKNANTTQHQESNSHSVQLPISSIDLALEGVSIVIVDFTAFLSPARGPVQHGGLLEETRAIGIGQVEHGVAQTNHDLHTSQSPQTKPPAR